MTLQSLMHIRTDAAGHVSRRTFLRSVGAGAGVAALGWKDAVALNAADLRQRGMACILLFMNGGPSQFETFDPKPDTKNGRPTKAIDTAVSGIHVAEHWPNVAERMKDVALSPPLTSKEGAHPAPVHQLHTGDVP